MSRFGKSVIKYITNDRKSTQTVPSASLAILEQECEKREALKLTKTLRYGFPHDPTSIAYDLVQHILAIGTRNGSVKIYGGESIEANIVHANQSPVLFMSFVLNEGALITYCEDSTLSFWNLRQKQPAASFSRKLMAEKATALNLPFQNKWLYVGTEKGNVYILNVYNNFSQSGYDIKWNNLIELSQKTHPGKIVHLSEHPLDNSKLLIGYETGLIVLWNIKHKKAECRLNANIDGNLLSISWFYDCKQLMSSYENGYLATWNLKSEAKPTITRPNYDETDLVKVYNNIEKVCWEATKNGDSMYIFSNGLPEQCSINDAITIVKPKNNKSVIKMKEKILDFFVIYPTPWQTDEPNDALALIVLLENSLTIIDLKSEGYPIFDQHHSVDLNESPISYYDYIVDPDLRLLQHLLVSKDSQSKNQPSDLPVYSQLQNPISGGIKGCKNNIFPYYELVLTGHEDGSVKLWEASGLTLDFIYEIETNKIFNKTRDNGNSIEFDCPYKICCAYIDTEHLVIASYGGHVTIYKYSAKKSNPADEELVCIPQLEIPHNYESSNDKNLDVFSISHASALQPNLDQSYKKDLKSLLRVRIGCKRQQGYQPELVCLFLWSQKPPVINNLELDTNHSILAIGTDESIICVDYQSRTVLINVQVSEYYGVHDISLRMAKSPKKSKTITDVYAGDDGSNDNNAFSIFTKQLTLDSNFNNLQRTMDATFGESSKSPSTSSGDLVILTEGCSFIAFNEQSQLPNGKNDLSNSIVSNMWFGTTYGTVIVLNINSIPNDNSTNSSMEASTNQVLITPTGSKYSLKGPILNISFLDCNGSLIQKSQNNVNTSTSNQTWSSPNNCNKEENALIAMANNLTHTYSADDTKLTKPAKKPLLSTRSAKLENQTFDIPDRHQYAVLCSESEVKVILLPAQNCVYKHTFEDDKSVIAKATVTSINNLAYLLCYTTNGSLLVYNLPTLKLNSNLSVINCVKDKDEMQRISKSFTFGSNGHAYFMCTPTEMQKLVLSSNIACNINEILPELFDPKITMPLAPKPSLFKSIFNTSVPLDREQLFGESSGKPTTSIVRNTVEGNVERTKGELTELQKAALLRGEKLSHLEKRTEEMSNQAQNFAKNASELANKYKKKSQWF